MTALSGGQAATPLVIVQTCVTTRPQTEVTTRGVPSREALPAAHRRLQPGQAGIEELRFRVVRAGDGVVAADLGQVHVRSG